MSLWQERRKTTKYAQQQNKHEHTHGCSLTLRYVQTMKDGHWYIYQSRLSISCVIDSAFRHDLDQTIRTMTMKVCTVKSYR